MNKGALRFYNKIRSKGISPKKVCEVGVYLPEESNLIGFINDNVDTTLIEADPDYVKAINKYFAGSSNLTVHNAAVYDYNGTVELCKRKSSTFVSELKSSPAIVNDKYVVDEGDKFIAKSIKFSEIDNGDFDVLSIDIEGAEWFVIKHLVSRPLILSIETHGKYYKNPYLKEISNWINENGYKIWYKDKSDTVFVKDDTFKITIFEKLELIITEMKLYIFSQKKYLKAIFK